MAKLDVIAGFLGAGKTTFISHYIAWLTTQNIKYAVIENEFGVAGIDAETLREKGAKVKEISGGCICCTMQVSLHSLLSELSQEVDRIILEPSGLFNGDDFIGILQNPTLKSSLRKGMWLGVVDPLALPLFSEPEVEVLADELIFAGSVLISKTRLADETRIAAAVRSIENMVPAPKPLIFTADWESYTPDIWFPQLQHSGFQTRPHERKAINHRLLYESARLLPSGEFSEDRLRAVAEDIMRSDAGEILRIKGFVSSKSGGTFALNCTPGNVSIQQSEGRFKPVLNIIGRDLDRGKIKKMFQP
ncbi:MAG: CobW family GTP-binding protein [Fastidiosipilaceae bacterium]|jgi:G3E family GTPase